MTQLQQIEQTERQAEVIKLLTTTQLTHEQIADQLNISRSTVERDINDFLNSDKFSTWLKNEWMRLHKIMLTDYPKEAHRALTQLIKRGGIEVQVLQKDNIDRKSVV